MIEILVLVAIISLITLAWALVLEFNNDRDIIDNKDDDFISFL